MEFKEFYANVKKSCHAFGSFPQIALYITVILSPNRWKVRCKLYKFENFHIMNTY